MAWWSCIGAFIERFQTLLVGIVGFGGVALTLAKNASLAREQHDRQIAHERKSLRTALRAELEIIREAYQDRVDMMLKPATSPTAYVLVPVATMTPVHSQSIGRIGLLDAVTVGLVQRAYILAIQLPDRVRILEQREGTVADAPNGFIRVGAEHFDTIRKLHQNYLNDINAAIAAIDADVS